MLNNYTLHSLIQLLSIVLYIHLNDARYFESISSTSAWIKTQHTKTYILYTTHPYINTITQLGQAAITNTYNITTYNYNKAHKSNNNVLVPCLHFTHTNAAIVTIIAHHLQNRQLKKYTHQQHLSYSTISHRPFTKAEWPYGLPTIF